MKVTAKALAKAMVGGRCIFFFGTWPILRGELLVSGSVSFCRLTKPSLSDVVAGLSTIVFAERLVEIFVW